MAKRPLRTVDICFDYNCNFDCKHCYAAHFTDKNRSFLNIAQIRRVIDICSKQGAIHFNITGGEPTLNKNLFDIIDYIHKKSALVSLATNGSMLTLEYARDLKKYKLDVALISLDYLDELRQDRFRGKGFFQKAMRGIENCLSVGLKVFISTVLTKINLRDGSIEELLSFCKNKNILLHTNLPALYGKWKNRDDLFLDQTDKVFVRNLYKDRYIRACEMSAYFTSACRTGSEKLHITAYGDVMPCTFIPISFGNILQEELSLIRSRMLKFRFINAHNEMCIPSTNMDYHLFFKEKVAPYNKFPVSFDKL